ncbi:hypothetical protein MLD38_001557 [Melastoma candidum]|uniref:Uncharacterized protein n=1 Tax=Melastoma candidum TaxID=119954 RepID=A0ACB9SDQ1_9MYRT|nr:hypothetical protein MLD38_001557 [Melastoma candidum]
MEMLVNPFGEVHLSAPGGLEASPILATNHLGHQQRPKPIIPLTPSINAMLSFLWHSLARQKSRVFGRGKVMVEEGVLRLDVEVQDSGVTSLIQILQPSSYANGDPMQQPSPALWKCGCGCSSWEPPQELWQLLIRQAEATLISLWSHPLSITNS